MECNSKILHFETEVLGTLYPEKVTAEALIHVNKDKLFTIFWNILD
jgi:hypothetical protein